MERPNDGLLCAECGSTVALYGIGHKQVAWCACGWQQRRPQCRIEVAVGFVANIDPGSSQSVRIPAVHPAAQALRQHPLAEGTCECGRRYSIQTLTEGDSESGLWQKTSVTFLSLASPKRRPRKRVKKVADE